MNLICAKKDLTIKLKDLGLTEYEYNEIIKRLKRPPNELELYLFSAMWSEHCGYKHSKKYLKMLPSSGACYRDENSGGIKIGKHIIFFKTESHNHPSAIEPYQGAATGIGGILRDILAMNARPIALLNSLKFGMVENNKNKYLLNGVVEGISDYGNCTGVPTIGGEISFNECYNLSPLVNVMAVGLCKEKNVKKAAAKENALIILIGSSTGTDGLYGAAFASKELENTDENRISVQIADPYTKKKLIEATLQILKSKNVFSCQDLGAAGLLSSTAEMGQKGKTSIELYLDRVPLREKSIKPYEIMLSETQERMIFTANKKGADEIFKICKYYEINAAIIGKTSRGNTYSLFNGKEKLCSLDIDVLVNPPLYEFENQTECKKNNVKKFEKIAATKDLIFKIVENPEFASKKYVYSQYDFTVGARTIKNPHCLGVSPLDLYEENKIIGFSMDSNEKSCYLNPYQGAYNLIFESYRNAVSSGFEPLGITNCLNFANPSNKDTGNDFIQTIKGMKDALETLKIPVVSGNVSFYNEGIDPICNKKTKIYPTPVIGTLSVMKTKKPLYARLSLNDTVFMTGKKINEFSNTGGSLYQKILFDFTGNDIDKTDTGLEFLLKKMIFELDKKNLLNGSMDISKGGLLGSLLIMLFNSPFNAGFKGYLTDDLNMLFGEITGRYLISGKEEIENYLIKNNIPYEKLGKCTDDGILNTGFAKIELCDLKEIYFNSLKFKVV